jgi:hypothetical protein
MYLFFLERAEGVFILFLYLVLREEKKTVHLGCQVWHTKDEEARLTDNECPKNL